MKTTEKEMKKKERRGWWGDYEERREKKNSGDAGREKKIKGTSPIGFRAGLTSFKASTERKVLRLYYYYYYH